MSQNKLGSDPLERITPETISRVMADLGRRSTPAKRAASAKSLKKARAALAKKRAAK